jgi:hypothetical protein
MLGALLPLRPAFALSSFSGVHPPVFLVRAAHHDPERLIRDSPLQRLHFVGNCATSAPRDAADVTDREAATYWGGAA